MLGHFRSQRNVFSNYSPTFDVDPIHPFSDENGRTARLLMNMVNMKFKIPPFSPKSDKIERANYFEAFSSCDKEESKTPMLHYMGKRLLEIMEQAIQ